ncbi:UNVERIFIED_ORG: hypothetical protein J2X79_001949 [Arthrobacter globiformis]|nr:hypothetical protein [Arthrobacter globiformis]
MTHRPALDPATFAILAEHVGNPAAESFLATYLDMLPGRLERIVQALETRDAEEAMDAVMSLKVTSAMAGARHLEHECAQLLASVQREATPAYGGVVRAAALVAR